jgi:diguanylate cyclase
VSDRHTDWKARYLLALETQERLEHEHEERERELARAVNRISLACEGQEQELDVQLAGLRDFIRKGRSLPIAILASKIDVVDERIRLLEERNKGTESAAAAAVDALLSQLTFDELPGGLKRRIASLRRQAHERLQRTGGIEEILRACAGLQDEVLQALRGQAAGRSGLLARLFGQPASAAPEALPDALRNAPPAAPVGAAARKALDALIDTVEAPEHDRPNRALFESAKTRIARGVRLDELVTTLDTVRVLAAAALARNRDEFGQFLQQLNERLAAAGTAASGAHALSQQRAAAGSELSAAIERNIAGMRQSADAATDVEQLKREAREHIEQMTSAMTVYRHREDRIQAEFGQRVSALEERVRELESHARAAEARVAEQRRIALTDRLSQLPNREAFERRLTEECERRERHGSPLSLALCDIDNFKRVNDTFGHAAGDAVIAAVAATLRAALRGGDFVARYGGEEFVLLLPGIPAPGAVQPLETLRAALENVSVAHGNHRITVTGSFGLAEFHAGDSPERVFTRADAALYRAKSEGRNRVCVYEGDQAAPT